MEGKNLQAAFSGAELPEQSREALKSDTWQKAREVLKKGISETDGETYADVESIGGFTKGAWKGVLHEYLRTSYKHGEPMCDIESGGTTYKVLKKDDKVTFYDADGNTLFDASYEQMEKENAVLMEQQKTAIEGNRSAKDAAQKKLEKELEKAKDKSFAEPVIGYLIERCNEDEGLSQDVIQEHKAWEKCYEYIYSEAEKYAQKGSRSCAVREDAVYEWAEDYYRKDDKAEEERKAKKAEEARKKAEERAAKAKEKTEKKSAGAKEDSNIKAQEGAKAVPDGAKKDHVKPKKNTRDMEGQLDMFSMMGM